MTLISLLVSIAAIESASQVCPLAEQTALQLSSTSPKTQSASQNEYQRQKIMDENWKLMDMMRRQSAQIQEQKHMFDR